MDAGTAKPSAAARAQCPHHLIDIIDPTDSYSAARFRNDASRLLKEIAARGRIPLLVGGTMLYVKALLGGIDALPSANAEIRQQIDREAAARGWPAMHEELAKLDPATASRLAPNDAQRIQRALEVIRLSGKPLSAQIGAATKSASPPGLIIALLPSNRLALHRRIERRFDAMLEAGLIGELAHLRQQFVLQRNLPSMRCVGYRQAWEYLEGEIDDAGLHAKGVAATRQLAKRQLTWLRAMPKLTVFDCLESDLEAHVAGFVVSHMAQAIH
jgi:tRNA dimethylallyltransferase